MVNYLGVDLGEPQEELDVTRDAYAQFSYLMELYKFHLAAIVEAEGDNE